MGQCVKHVWSGAHLNRTNRTLYTGGVLEIKVRLHVNCPQSNDLPLSKTSLGCIVYTLPTHPWVHLHCWAGLAIWSGHSGCDYMWQRWMSWYYQIIIICQTILGSVETLCGKQNGKVKARDRSWHNGGANAIHDKVISQVVLSSYS